MNNITQILISIFIFSVEVLATLTSDVGRILSKLHQVQPNGNLSLITGIRIAHVSYLMFFSIMFTVVTHKINMKFLHIFS